MGISRFYNKPVQIVILIILAVASNIPNAYADADEELRVKILTTVNRAWRQEDFELLETTEKQYIPSSQRTLSGKRRLAVFDDYLSSLISIEWPTKWGKKDIVTIPDPKYFSEANKRWDVIEEKLKRWEEESPDSTSASLARAQYYINRAWFFRGNGLAHTVSKEAWPIFYQNMDAAEKTLMKIYGARIQNPRWFDMMFEIYGIKSSQISSTEHQKLLQDFLEHGQGYPPAYQSALHYLDPRWGGSFQQVEALVMMANQKTAKEEQGTLYARLYWNFETSYRYGSGFFEKTEASWPMLKGSFKKMIKLYPTARNFSSFAMFSCTANDVSGAKELLKQAGTDAYIKNWPAELRKRCLEQSP